MSAEKIQQKCMSRCEYVRDRNECYRKCVNIDIDNENFNKYLSRCMRQGGNRNTSCESTFSPRVSNNAKYGDLPNYSSY
jgi:hypothetical protein